MLALLKQVLTTTFTPMFRRFSYPLMFNPIVFLIVFQSTAVVAQPLLKPFRTITTANGLPQSYVSGLVQDKNGFVWIGTRNGLARFDGTLFKIFNHRNQDSNSLSNNLVVGMRLDKQNKVWVEQENRILDCIDPVTEKLEHITARPLFSANPVLFIAKGWLAAADGSLWCTVMGEGVYHYDWAANKVTHFSKTLGTLNNDTVRALLQDRHNNLWLLGEHGLSKYNAEKGKFTHTSFPFATHFTKPGERYGVTAFCQRGNGELMLGASEKLVFYNPENNTFRTVPISGVDNLSGSLMQPGPDGKEYVTVGGIVYQYTDAKGLVAFADIGRESFRDAMAFLVDKAGLIWMGTNANGIYLIDPARPFFPAYTNAVAFHNDLMLKEKELRLYQFASWSEKNNGFSGSSYFVRSTLDAQNNLWLALGDKVIYADSKLEKIVQLPAAPVFHPENYSTITGVRGISFAPDGRLWIVDSEDYIAYFDALQKRWIPFMAQADFLQLGANNMFCDLQAGKDTLWITSAGSAGLIGVEIHSKKIFQFTSKTQKSIPTDVLITLEQDRTRPELLWLASYDGLICFNKKTFTSQLFTKAQGLPDNTIYNIQTDKNGYLWLGTNNGLCRFHPVTHEVRIFQTKDGLPGNEFNRYHDIQLPDGRLGFGGTDGWTLFDPLSIQTDKFQTPVAITGLHINYEPADSLKEKLTQPINNLTTLSLPYDQNTLTFAFAGLEYNQPEKIKFRYRLIGYDDQWIVTTNPVAYYTKLPFGHYTLEINASNTSGQWSNQIKLLWLQIKPPLWRTWWAFGLYILFILSLMLAYVRFRVNKVKMRQEIILRQQQVELKEKEAKQLKAVDELKTRFFSNITHEFRTPISLILLPVQKLKELFTSEQHLYWLSAIERNANQLLGHINQLLDFSRLESDTLTVNETLGNINDFVTEQLWPYYYDAENSGIQLTLTAQPAMGNYWFDGYKLEQLVRNLVSNALKFTPKGGKVEVVLHNDNGLLPDKNGITLMVKDAGIGIGKERLPFIFNRFYQANNASLADSTKPSGFGIGLALVKELVELQKGSIDVKSEWMEGDEWHTIFTVWLPYRQAPETATATTATVKNTIPHYAESKPTEINATEAVADSQPVSLLLVEDNHELAGFIASSFPASYTVVHCVNGSEGLAQAFELMPDVVISDVMMPVMDGFEMCGHIKTDDRTNHIPVILLTAKGSFDSRIEGLSLGADDYLSKPFHIKELRLRVHNLLERQRRLREKLRLELSTPHAINNAEAPPAKNEELQDSFINKVYKLLDEQLDNPKLNVQELATLIGMSRSSLHNKLKAITGLSGGDVIRNYRLKRAAQFLRDGSNSSEAAYKVGFDSPAYFTKCFRELYGITPLEYVQQKTG